ncbi:Isochorismatase-like protein [Pisolithus marmoratus]|nr:Isochorismatase-like protein [Pisolithus marmoratus]
MQADKAIIPGTALIVVDMQVDFVTGSLAVPGATELLGPINDIIDLPFAYRVASKDFHPPGHISFATTHGKPLFETITIYPPEDLVAQTGGDVTAIGKRGLEQTLWPVHCVQGTPGVEIIPGLNVDDTFDIITKGTHPAVECYSAFKDPWDLLRTDLEDKLHHHGVKDVYLVGVAGDYCVKATAIDAARAGFNTFVVTDGVRSVSPGGEEYKEVEAAGVRIIDLAELKQRMQVA